MQTPVFTIDGVVRDYAWGSATAIQQLLGLPVDGRPAAELWLGAHPDDPSHAPHERATLDRLIAADPDQLLGTVAVDRFGPHLPFLLKVLAAGRAVSLQVHPSLAQAGEGFARENAEGIAQDAPNRTYRDANHKPELICALTEFDGLCGFRPVASTLRLLDDWNLPELAGLRAVLAGDGLRAAFTAILGLDDAESVVAAVVDRAAAEPTDTEWAGTARAIGYIAQDFPGDVGAVLALLLNDVRLQPGEALFLGAGNVHSYLRGVGVEIMANSDNVLRCALTPKHVDVDELLRITDFDELAEPRLIPEETDDFVVPVPDFELLRFPLGEMIKPGSERASVAVGAQGPCIVLNIEGSCTVETEGSAVSLTPGRAAFVCARERAFTLAGDGLTFVATTGRL